MSSPERVLPVLGFAASSGTGKTTLLRALIPRLGARGLRIGVIKHAHHDFDIDQPGKDSYVLRKAGAEQMLIASDRRWALMTEQTQPRAPQLDELLRKLDRDRLDLVLIEGFKGAPIPKIEIHRSAVGEAGLYRDDAWIIAVASDRPGELVDSPAALPLDDADAIAEFVGDWLSEQHHETR
jgi:molybdopterin-guanine dinucleotide biosynthesis protein MobB